MDEVTFHSTQSNEFTHFDEYLMYNNDESLSLKKN